jgi:hypothetical protein
MNRLQTPADPADIIDPARHSLVRTPNVLAGIGGCFWRLNGSDGRAVARAVNVTVPAACDGEPMGWLVRHDDGRVLLRGGDERAAVGELLRLAIEVAIGDGEG